MLLFNFNPTELNFQSPALKVPGTDDVNQVREYVIRNLKANGVDWQSVLEVGTRSKIQNLSTWSKILNLSVQSRSPCSLLSGSLNIP